MDILTLWNTLLVHPVMNVIKQRDGASRVRRHHNMILRSGVFEMQRGGASIEETPLSTQDVILSMRKFVIGGWKLNTGRRLDDVGAFGGSLWSRCWMLFRRRLSP